MSILDKLKEFFKNIGKKEQPKLPESTKTRIEQEVSFRDKYRVNQLPTLREPSFEECVDEFIKQYNFQNEVNPDRYGKAYRAFRRMFCDEEEYIGNNFKEQEKLIEKIEGKTKRKTKDKKYSIASQASNGRRSFIHISGEKGLDEFEDLNLEKIYINCERKNIALLAGIIFDSVKVILGDRLQMKFLAEQDPEKETETKNYQRNEKIVLYVENHEIALRIAEVINGIRSKRPELFSSKKTLPFLSKKFGIVGIDGKRKSNLVVTPAGKAGGSTYNDYISDIFEKCIIAGFDEDIGTDWQENTDDLEERMGTYAEIYQDMDESQRAIIMRNIRRIFGQVSKEYNINTVYKSNAQVERQGNGEQEFEGYIDM